MKKASPTTPICITGVVQKALPISICMDGATHEMRWGFVGAVLRLIPRDKATERHLDNVVGQYVSVYGYLNSPTMPTCQALIVYDVAEVAAMEEKLAIKA